MRQYLDAKQQHRDAILFFRMGDFRNTRLIIDVASDLPSDGGQSIPVRDDAVATGVTINALAIVDDLAAPSERRAMVDFYRHDVIGGIGAFVIEALDYAAFSEALKEKLLREIAWR